MQLYETVQVRHGLMLVGAPMGGKTLVTETLADALSRIEKAKAIEAQEKLSGGSTPAKVESPA